mmetsp:Transcript_92955/g.267433  ORF Transcript_92955/g.267433 Transcript_92955/m.267433 type:complete len:300 (-) Transcript_92955:1536-2435(-)
MKVLEPPQRRRQFVMQAVHGCLELRACGAAAQVRLDRQLPQTSNSFLNNRACALSSGRCTAHQDACVLLPLRGPPPKFAFQPSAQVLQSLLRRLRGCNQGRSRRRLAIKLGLQGGDFHTSCGEIVLRRSDLAPQNRRAELQLANCGLGRLRTTCRRGGCLFHSRGGGRERRTPCNGEASVQLLAQGVRAAARNDQADGTAILAQGIGTGRRTEQLSPENVRKAAGQGCRHSLQEPLGALGAGVSLGSEAALIELAGARRPAVKRRRLDCGGPLHQGAVESLHLGAQRTNLTGHDHAVAA